jgi:hypothetical protein
LVAIVWPDATAILRRLLAERTASGAMSSTIALRRALSAEDTSLLARGTLLEVRRQVEERYAS